MRGINRAHFIGSLAQPPALSYTPGGLAVLALTVANRLPVTLAGGVTERNSYTYIKTFGSYAEVLSGGLRPGDVVEVFGRVERRQSQAEHGRYNEYVTIVAETILSLVGPFSFTDDGKGQSVLLGGINRVTLGGNVTRGVFHGTGADKSVARFTLAVDGAAQGHEDQVNFLRVSASGELAARVAEVAQGVPLIASGQLLTDAYTTPDGERHYTTHLVAETLHLVSIPARARTRTEASESLATPVG